MNDKLDNLSETILRLNYSGDITDEEFMTYKAIREISILLKTHGCTNDIKPYIDVLLREVS